MTTHAAPGSRLDKMLPVWISWWPVAVGLLAVLLPSIVDASRGLWDSEAYAHSPIVLAIVIWLFWRNALLAEAIVEASAAVAGWITFLAGVLVFVVGRSQSIVLLEFGSFSPILAGLILILQGWAGLRRHWFAVTFLVFFVPLPGFVIDGITGGLKDRVSTVAEFVLYGLGYPIARDGVTLTIGQYQLLVADACSGLNSMFSLSAMGVLYMYLMSRGRRLHNALLLASILPIAFVANIIRVITLVLIVYYLGDAAGQGFLHRLAGMALFLVALSLLFSFDWLLYRIPLVMGKRKGRA